MHQKRLFRPKKEETLQDSNLFIEFWEKDGPHYYDFNLPSQRFVPPDFQPNKAYLTFSNPCRTQVPGNYTVIAIFRKEMPLLILPGMQPLQTKCWSLSLLIAFLCSVKSNDKQFRYLPPRNIGVDYNQGDNFKGFAIQWVNRTCTCLGKPGACDKTPWEGANCQERDVPTIPLELTLLNLSRGGQTQRLEGLLRSYQLANARFLLQQNNIEKGLSGPSLSST